MIVAKFGGTSLADGARFRHVAEIIRADPNRRYVVVSAPGKRCDSDIKVTDLLYRFQQSGNQADFAPIEARFREIVEDLGISLDLSEDFAEMKQLPHNADYLASCGEYLSARIMAAFLDWPFVDAEECVFFDEQGNLDEVKTRHALFEKLRRLPHAVLPGYYGVMPDGQIHTFSRGGSDISGALVASAMDAQVYENWTDVDGMLVTDPRIVPQAAPLRAITYQRSVWENEDSRFILAQKNTSTLIKSSTVILSDVADVVTGFYTGDNTRFIRALNKQVKGSKKYEIIDPDEIHDCTSLSGIPNVDIGYIPYIKNASQRRYIRENDEWFVRWDKPTIDFYNNNKKSRFQNSGYYFKTGIGIPMVKSKTIRAFLMENRVFDQAIVGIFPHNPMKINYLLALMNSDIVNTLIHTINPTANNSANYVKQIPYFEPDETTLKHIDNLVEDIKVTVSVGNIGKVDSIHEELNSIFSKIYS